MYAAQTDSIGPPCCAGIIPGATAWKGNALRALPFLRWQYTDRTVCDERMKGREVENGKQKNPEWYRGFQNQ